MVSNEGSVGLTLKMSASLSLHGGNLTLINCLMLNFSLFCKSVFQEVHKQV